MSIGIFEIMVVCCQDITEHTKHFVGKIEDILLLNLSVHVVASRHQTVKRTV